MQKTMSVCDACGAEDLPGGHVVLNVGGDRAVDIRGNLPGGRGSVDLCDACGGSFAEWLQGRQAKARPEGKDDPEKDAERHPHRKAPAAHGHAPAKPAKDD